MEAYSEETLTILVLIAVILSSVTFIAVSILIICLLRIQYQHSETISPIDTRRSSSVDSHSSIPSPIPRRNPVINSKKRHEQRSPSNSISIIDEHFNDNRKKYSHIYNHDETTLRNENQVHSQHHQRKLTTDIQFVDRLTPYPPDVIERERIMMTHLRIPRNKKS